MRASVFVWYRAGNQDRVIAGVQRSVPLGGGMSGPLSVPAAHAGASV